MSSRVYYGKHYPGQFIPLDCAIWTHGADEEDAILRATRQEEEERQARWSKMGPQARLCYTVFHALADNATYPMDKKDARVLQFWARSLEDCEKKGL